MLKSRMRLQEKECKIMFKNEVSLLKRENDRKARWLNEDDEDIIDEIMESIGIFRVNSFDTQVIRRDLIGMAEEAELRNSNMKEIIGDDIKTATYEIINSSSGYSKWEVFWTYLKYLSGMAFLMVGLVGMFINMRFTWEVSVVGLSVYFQYITYFFLVSKLVRPLLNMEGWGRLGFYWTMFLGFSMLIVPLNTLGTDLYGNGGSSINSGYILIISGSIFLASIYFQNKIIRKFAEDRKKFIDDLDI